MECVQTFCFYLILAVGAHDNQERNFDFREHYSGQVTQIQSRDIPEFDHPNPLGRVSVGVERGGWFLEAEHFSSLDTTEDNGFTAVWGGRKWQF